MLACITLTHHHRSKGPWAGCYVYYVAWVHHGITTYRGYTGYYLYMLYYIPT